MSAWLRGRSNTSATVIKIRGVYHILICIFFHFRCCFLSTHTHARVRAHTRRQTHTHTVRKEHGKGQRPTTTSSAAEQKLADVPSTVPEPPGALLPRSDLIVQIKSELLNKTGSSTAALASKNAKHKSSVHGMGGVGEKPRASGHCPTLPTLYLRLHDHQVQQPWPSKLSMTTRCGQLLRKSCGQAWVKIQMCAGCWLRSGNR